jgi:hypothetical protein
MPILTVRQSWVCETCGAAGAVDRPADETPQQIRVRLRQAHQAARTHRTCEGDGVRPTTVSPARSAR